MNTRTALILLTLAALVILGGIKLGNVVENLGNEIAEQRVAALGR